MKTVTTIILCLLLSMVSPALAGNKKMIEERTKELDELNQQAVKQIPDLPADGRVDLKAKGTYSGDDINIEVIDYRIETRDGKADESPNNGESVEKATPVEDKSIDLGGDIRKNSSKGEAIENATSND